MSQAPPKALKLSPHALKSMQAERDAYAAVAQRYKAGTLERWQADERVKQLNAQIARVMDTGEQRPQQPAFRATGIPGGDDKAYGNG